VSGDTATPPDVHSTDPMLTELKANIFSADLTVSGAPKTEPFLDRF
jgi:hypothetical protein